MTLIAGALPVAPVDADILVLALDRIDDTLAAIQSAQEVSNCAGKPFLDKARIQHPKLVTDGADRSTASIPRRSKLRY